MDSARLRKKSRCRGAEPQLKPLSRADCIKSDLNSRSLPPDSHDWYVSFSTLIITDSHVSTSDESSLGLTAGANVLLTAFSYVDPEYGRKYCPQYYVYLQRR
jgi:hypothetical protein